jgi:hypothetical protein
MPASKTAESSEPSQPKPCGLTFPVNDDPGTALRNLRFRKPGEVFRCANGP